MVLFVDTGLALLILGIVQQLNQEEDKCIIEEKLSVFRNVKEKEGKI